MHWFRRLPGLLDLLLHGPTKDREPSGEPPVQEVVHIHKWDICRYNGQYWYSRCIAAEWCTARRAC